MTIDMLSVRYKRNPQSDNYGYFTVTINCNGVIHEEQLIIHQDDFTSMFDFLIENAKRNIKERIKDYEKMCSDNSTKQIG